MLLNALCSVLVAVAPAAPSAGLPAWPEFEQAHLVKCMAPFDARSQPLERKVGNLSFVIEGSVARRVVGARDGVKDDAGSSGARSSEVAIGLLGAIKEADEGTRANIERARKAFKKAGVEIVIANGDVALNQFDLEDAMKMLGRTGLPVFVLIGNSEGRGGFNRAFVAAEKEHPNLFNLNWLRQVDLGPVVLLSLPGYYDRRFMGQGSGCRYKKEDVTELGRQADRLFARKRTAVLVSHGPPRSTGKRAIDHAFEAGNVGDPDLTDVIENSDLRFGLYSHILEAGGRATYKLSTGKLARQDKRFPGLHVNAGSASSAPWGMLDGSSSLGMATIVRVGPAGASYRVIDISR